MYLDGRSKNQSNVLDYTLYWRDTEFLTAFRCRLLCSEDMNIPDPKVLEEAEELYFEVFNIQPMRLNLSFVRTERINAAPADER